jgi:mannose-6-phosphate isomerase
MKKADSTITLNGPYAELWMGTHPSGPSKIKESQELLSLYLKNKDHLIGFVPPGYPNDDLPFLFKGLIIIHHINSINNYYNIVLSINTALSIQAHPDKQLAVELNTKFPTIYKDNNHKPEMAIALTKFEAICGFRHHDEVL